MTKCRAPECDFEVGWDDLDEIVLVDGRGWWKGRRGFCPDHAEAIQDGDLGREEVCSTYSRKTRSIESLPETGFIQMEGSRYRGTHFPPHVDDDHDSWSKPIDDYHAEIRRVGKCPHDGCDFEGSLMKYTGHNCPHMCPECGGMVLA